MIRWKRVVNSILKLLLILWIGCALEMVIIPTYRKFGLVHYSWIEFITIVLQSMVSVTIIKLCTFYFIFHSLQNAVGELLGFRNTRAYMVS